MPARAAKGAVHAGCLPYDALFEGLFLDRGAAKQYLQLYGAPPQPYGREALAANTQQLRALVSSLGCCRLQWGLALQWHRSLAC